MLLSLEGISRSAAYSCAGGSTRIVPRCPEGRPGPGGAVGAADDSAAARAAAARCACIAPITQDCIAGLSSSNCFQIDRTTTPVIIEVEALFNCRRQGHCGGQPVRNLPGVRGDLRVSARLQPPQVCLQVSRRLGWAMARNSHEMCTKHDLKVVVSVNKLCFGISVPSTVYLALRHLLAVHPARAAPMLMLVLCRFVGRVPSCTSSQMRPKRAPCAARISSRLVIR